MLRSGYAQFGMSHRPQGEDWWLATDGKWYPPESRPQSPQPHAWEEAAQTLGLDVTSRSGFGGDEMHGSIDDFLVEVVQERGLKASSTTFRVVSPDTKWDDRRLFRIEPPGGRVSEIYKRLRPTTFTTTGDTEFDQQLVVWAKGPYHATAQRFLTLERRQALLRLHRLIPTARLFAWPRDIYLTCDTSDDVSRAEVTHHVRAMVAAAKDLTGQS